MSTAVLLWSNSPGVRKATKNAVAPLKAAARGCGPRNLPRQADAVVTTGALNSSVERLAARMGTPWVFVLPEAAQALADFVARPGGAVLAGADLASLESLAKADMNVNKQQEVLL